MIICKKNIKSSLPHNPKSQRGWKQRAASLDWTKMDSGLSVRQINIRKYLRVLFHGNVSMATADGSL